MRRRFLLALAIALGSAAPEAGHAASDGLAGQIADGTHAVDGLSIATPKTRKRITKTPANPPPAKQAVADTPHPAVGPMWSDHRLQVGPVTVTPGGFLDLDMRQR